MKSTYFTQIRQHRTGFMLPIYMDPVGAIAVQAAQDAVDNVNDALPKPILRVAGF